MSAPNESMDADSSPSGQAKALESLLRWYVAMGADASLDESSHDRFSVPPVSTKTAIQAPAPPPARTTGPAEDMVREACTTAASATSLADLRDRWSELAGCGLRSTATCMIFADGNPKSRFMVIGGAPLAEDERCKTAFSGPQGDLLNAMLAAIGLTRQRSYLTNVVPWRPPGNRAPTPLELALCLPFARRHIELINPSFILCLGERAAQPLLQTREAIGRLRGRWLSFEGRSKTVKTLVTFSPDFILTQPLQKRRVWADLLMVDEALRST